MYCIENLQTQQTTFKNSYLISELIKTLIVGLRIESRIASLQQGYDCCIHDITTLINVRAHCKKKS